ncbi:unnamed protein product [Symbiodinium sp. CCMP2592]|nr:unnamed protein product [Symbiodinium sp. CCMP2592]
MKRLAPVQPETWSQLREEEIEEQENQLLEAQARLGDLLAERRQMAERIRLLEAENRAFMAAITGLTQDLQHLVSVLEPQVSEAADAADAAVVQYELSCELDDVSMALAGALDRLATAADVAERLRGESEAETQTLVVEQAGLRAHAVLDENQDAQPFVMDWSP